MKWDKNDESDARIKKASNWIPISNYKEFSDDTGTYIFANNVFDVKYIGKAGADRMVVEAEKMSKIIKIFIPIFEIYNAIYRKKNHLATKVKVLYTKSEAIALEIEGELILKYNPINNGRDILQS